MVMMMMKARQIEGSPATTMAIAFDGEAFGPRWSSSHRKLCNVSLGVMGRVLVSVTGISHLEGGSLEGCLSSHW